MDTTLKTIAEQYCSALKERYGSREAGSIASLVMEHVTGLSRTELIMHPERLVEAGQEKTFRCMLEELTSGKPVQYVIGHSWFYGMRFMVTPAVLIPRPETEELVEKVIKESEEWRAESEKKEKFRQEDSVRILDIGTGSGCIAVSLKKNIPGAEVFALDVSEKALALAEQNARDNAASVHFIKEDILHPSSAFREMRFDVIVSNPPYVPLSERSGMSSHVVDHEPSLALFVDDADPLKFYHAIAGIALEQLNSGGRLYFEINSSFSKELTNMLEEKGFSGVQLTKDLQGRFRILQARKS